MSKNINFLTDERNNKIKIIDNNTIPVLPQGKNHKKITNPNVSQPKTVPTQKMSQLKNVLTKPKNGPKLIFGLTQAENGPQRNGSKTIFRMSTVAHIPSGDSIKSDRPANHGSTNHDLRFKFNQFDIHNSIDQHFYNPKYTQGN